MLPITEKDEFSSLVPLLEEGDEVKGGLEGASNAQALALANRTRFLENKRQEMETQLNELNQELAGLDADKVGADEKGTADTLVTEHVAEPNPHTQYLLKSEGNKANGYLQLDSSGKVPAGVITGLQARYIAVVDQAARLALPKIDDLTIAAQQSDSTLYYLNGTLDPANTSNWIKGQSAVANGVISAFGRAGIIVATTGDYTTDQINETISRLFVSPTEKQTWNQKQAQLVSGTNIKTFRGVSILGTGDLTFTATDIGGAEKIHKHVVADVTDFEDGVGAQLGLKIKAGSNMQVVYDPSGKNVTLNATGGGGTGGSGYGFVDRLGSTAGQTHVVNLEATNLYIKHAYALKKELGLGAQPYLVDSFNAASEPFYNHSSWVQFNGYYQPLSLVSVNLVNDGARYSYPMDTNLTTLTLNATTLNFVPVISNSVGASGYIATASSEFSSSYRAYLAFSNVNNGGNDDGWASIASPTTAAPQWLCIELPTAMKITAYSIITRFSGAIAPPSKWKLQGSNDKSAWTDVGDVETNADLTPGLEIIRQVRPTIAYKYYRVYITDRIGNPNGTNDWTFVMIQRLRLFVDDPVVLRGATDSDLYTVANNALVKLTDISDASIRASGITQLNKFPSASMITAGITKVVGLTAQPIKMTVDAPAQIAILKTPIAAKIWSKISAFVATASESGNGKVRYAVSPDNKNYYAFSSGSWIGLGELGVNSNSANIVNTQGMTTNALNALTATNIAGLLTLSGQSSWNTLNFAYSVSGFGVADVSRLDSMVLTVDNLDTWKTQAASEVEIRYGNNALTFKTISAGDYKLIYLL